MRNLKICWHDKKGIRSKLKKNNKLGYRDVSKLKKNNKLDSNFELVLSQMKLKIICSCPKCNGMSLLSNVNQFT